MEILCPTTPYLHGSGWLAEPRSRRSSGGVWTHEENKRFEYALAEFDEGTPDRWEKVAGWIPGKSAEDVRRHYQDLEADVTHIEAGLIPPPGYDTPRFAFEWESSQALEGLKHCYLAEGKRPGGRACEQERKKGIPWTEDEHKRFLMGLKKYGKGDWRNISRKFVISRTPTQVASHAQKYHLRRSSSGKDKRRPSIHDITTVDVSDSRPPSPPAGPPPPSAVYGSSLLGPSTLPPEIYNTASAWLVSPAQSSQLFRSTPDHGNYPFGV